MTDSLLENLNKDIDESVLVVIGELVMTWARLDSLVSQWVILEFGMDTDSGPILLGNMDTRGKLDRLKQLYEHHGAEQRARAVANLIKLHATYVETRNTVAHTMCAGRLKSDPNKLVFAPVKPLKGSPGMMVIQYITIEGIRRAIRFADQAADRLAPVTDALLTRPLQPRTEPPEFPSFPDPSPQRKRANKRQRPRRERRR